MVPVEIIKIIHFRSFMTSLFHRLLIELTKLRFIYDFVMIFVPFFGCNSLILPSSTLIMLGLGFFLQANHEFNYIFQGYPEKKDIFSSNFILLFFLSFFMILVRLILIKFILKLI